ncbi:hypothetical protein NDU88_005940 [Pleurodeles waltl]|uniref:Uncharacterized protein n=1 Tax=Pleurodeles waltl TaxID=8319 RepID=A0AAV7TC67_PLEWA|nr:hypothetical protein NDU88_005940 [Pleurodeles waltl]
MVTDIKDVGDLGLMVDALEQSGDAYEEELDSYQGELLELQDKNAELRFQLEDLENRSRWSNIRIKGVPLQTDTGNLEEYVHGFFHHVVPELTPQDFILDHTHRAGRPANSL